MIHRRKMSHVDALSRVVSYVEPMPLERELELKQELDPRLKAIAEELEFVDHDKFVLILDLVYRKGEDKPRFAVPESMVNNIIRVYHDEMAHCGLEKTIQGITSNYWFPSLRRRTREYIENCLICLASNSSANSREGQLQETDNSDLPFEALAADHFGPLKKSSDSTKHILLLIYVFTRFTWLFPVKNTSSKEVIKLFTGIFNAFGNPQTLVTNRGTAFTSREFAEFMKARNIKHQVAVAG